MANIIHANMTDSDGLHEPKGAAAATSGQVYEADGAGSGSWTDNQPVGIASASAGELFIADGAGSGTWSFPCHAAANIGSTQVIATTGISTFVKVTGWGELESDGLTFDGTDDDWTVVTPGDYLIVSSLSLDASAVTTTTWELDVHIDGVALGQEIQRTTKGTEIGVASVNQYAINLTAGQTIDIRLRQTGTAAINMNVQRANIFLRFIG